jgi:beta-ribofuranosylaminobenzene 5'-phosphate synthase
MIEVRTCARLHLGLLDSNGGHGRLYGSIGLAVNQPRLLLRAEPAESLIVEGLEIDRVTAYARRFIQRYGVPAGARLNLIAGIPAHVGLGSGTQIALAVGTALARLSGLRLSIGEIAVAAGRGLRSGIGIATFQRGGFVLDGGHHVAASSSIETGNPRPENDGIPPILFHHPVPRGWHFVTAISGSGQGISGERENSAFSRLPEAAPEMAERISRLLLMKMMPALIENDIATFGQALTEIQQLVGDCFAEVQGGRYSNPLAGRLIDFLLSNGAAGAGQSSWGPAVYGLIEGQGRARRLAKEVQLFLKNSGGGQVFCVRPQNRGATVKDLNAKRGAGNRFWQLPG